MLALFHLVPNQGSFIINRRGVNTNFSFSLSKSQVETTTVQAPQPPSAQPSLVPVSPVERM